MGRVIAFALAALLLMAYAEPLVAQVPEFPTDCTEAMSAGNVFIGHDCGEWASVVISGRIIIRKPWTRANRANRGVRLRERRERGGATTAVPSAVTGQGETPAHGTAVMAYGMDVSGGTNPDKLDCEDFDTQAEAQAFFDGQGWSATNDPERLDQGGDPGIPCEDLP